MNPSVTRFPGKAASSLWQSPGFPVVVVAVLLCLGVANVVTRATFHEMEDGVLWVASPQGVVAAEVAEGTPADLEGLAPGDVLLAIDDRPIEVVGDVAQTLQAAGEGTPLRYTVLRLGAREVVGLHVAPVPNGSRPFYFLLAATGIITLLIGGAVRARRPGDPATLHFFWLSVASFGLFTFSFSGRLDRLDWIFYWGDAISMLLLPALFLHFALVFPERGATRASGSSARLLTATLYVPALALGAVRALALTRGGADTSYFVGILDVLDRFEYAYLAVYFGGGLIVLVRALREVRSITARRQLRWITWGSALGISPFAIGYALPWAMGAQPSLSMQLTAIPLGLVPLAYASAIVRYRLTDVEVIVKRALLYAAAPAAVGVIYAVLLQGFDRVVSNDGVTHNWMLAAVVTVIALLLAPWVKHTIQDVLDRAFYRDRLLYRRALVGFARDLNSDLDLGRLSERLVSRVTETLLVDRMALLIVDESLPQFSSVRALGFEGGRPPDLFLASPIGARVREGHLVALDDPTTANRFAAEDVEFWRDEGVSCFIPCVSNEGTIAVLALGRKESGEPISSEDTALLATVAAQVATALENARLYRQLHLKASELDRLRAFNENILESLHDGLLVVDLNDRVVRWNSALEQLYGMPRAETVGLEMSDIFDGPVVDAIRAARRDSPNGAVLSRLPMTSRRQEAMIVNIAVVPLRTASEESQSPVGTIVILEDVTRRVELEEQLQISEKMASIGLLAAGVAHEVNTPLTGISSFTQMLLEGADPEDPKTRILEKIERQTFRAARIVNGLLSLSRPPSATGRDVVLMPVDINVVLNDVLSLLEHQFQLQHIRVRRDLSASAVPVMGSEQKLQQVFLNLFLNAKDAMPKGGWLSVTTGLNDGKAVIEVADTGSGIPNEHLARIYDPFFTTKSIGRGTGLGLSISYGIVREHHGSIECDSVLGQGTRFVVEFPPAQSERPLRAAHQ